jgi:hypothetical protein
VVEKSDEFTSPTRVNNYGKANFYSISGRQSLAVPIATLIPKSFPVKDPESPQESIKNASEEAVS